jgi:hypothetical protein
MLPVALRGDRLLQEALEVLDLLRIRRVAEITATALAQTP